MSRLLMKVPAIALAGLLLACSGGSDPVAPAGTAEVVQDTPAAEIPPPPMEHVPRAAPRGVGGQWQTDIGPGVDIAYVASGSTDRIDVSCRHARDGRSALDFRLEGQRPEGRVTLVFGPVNRVQVDVQQGRMETRGGVDGLRFDEVVAGLRSHGSVTVRDDAGREAGFTLYNAARAIPADCRG